MLNRGVPDANSQNFSFCYVVFIDTVTLLLTLLKINSFPIYILRLHLFD